MFSFIFWTFYLPTCSQSCFRVVDFARNNIPNYLFTFLLLAGVKFDLREFKFLDSSFKTLFCIVEWNPALVPATWLNSGNCVKCCWKNQNCPDNKTEVENRSFNYDNSSVGFDVFRLKCSRLFLCWNHRKLRLKVIFFFLTQQTKRVCCFLCAT